MSELPRTVDQKLSDLAKKLDDHERRKPQGAEFVLRLPSNTMDSRSQLYFEVSMSNLRPSPRGSRDW
jgi:hypothetical protein